MLLSENRHRLLTGVSVIACSLLGYARSSHAACDPSPSPTFVCTGAELSTQFINVNNAAVSTVAGFSVDTILGNAVTIMASGTLSFTDTVGTPLTANGPGQVALFVQNNGPGAGSITINTEGELNGGNNAILARNFSTGATSVTTGSGAITSSLARAIDVFSSGSDIGVYTGDGNVTGGFGAIYAAQQGSGAITIGTGAGKVEGLGDVAVDAKNVLGSGITITTAGGAVIGSSIAIRADNQTSGALSITTGSGAVTGLTQAGIFANNQAGTSTLSITTNSGKITGRTIGIRSNQNGSGAQTLSIGAGGVESLTDSAVFAINGATATSLSVTTGSGNIVGVLSGLTAQNYGTGSTAVYTGSGAIIGVNSGLGVRNEGTDLIVMTGDGLVSGTLGGLTALQSGSGSALIQIGQGGVTSSSGRAIEVQSDASATTTTITTGSGSILGATGGIRVVNNGSGNTTINIGGLLSNSTLGPAGLAIQSTGRATTLNNLAAGHIVGFLSLTSNNDSFINDGLWETATSDFGGGTDSLANSGTIRTSFSAGVLEAVQFTRLEELSGVGTLDLSDEASGNGSQTHDSLYLDGNLVGGGVVQLDAFLDGDGSASADRLIINGNVTGVTQIQLLNTNPGSGGLNTTGIVLIEVNGTSSAGNFVLAGGPISTGLYTYRLEYDAGTFALFSEAAPIADVLPDFVSAQQDLWYSTLYEVNSRLEQRRDLVGAQSASLDQEAWLASDEAATGLSIWGRTNRHHVAREGTSAIYDLDSQGFLFGADIAFPGAFTGTGTLLVGLMAGHLSAEQDFTASGSSADYEGYSFGFYGTYLNEGLYIDALFKADVMELTYDLTGISETTPADVVSLGGRLEAGYRLTVGQRFFAEPNLTLSYLHSEIDGGAVAGTAFVGEGDSLRAAFGLRFGSHFTDLVDGWVVKPTVTARAWLELDGENLATFGEGDGVIAIADEMPGALAQFTFNLEAYQLGGGVSAFIEGDAKFGADYVSYGGTLGIRYGF